MIAHLLQTGSKKVFERSIVRHTYDRQSLARQRIIRVLESEGISCHKILKVRGDGRCVARGEHPRYGTVVVKTGVPSRNSHQVCTNLYLAGLVQQGGSGLFPKIHRAMLGYTVEAWVEGRELSKMDHDSIKIADIMNLLERIKHWSMTHATGDIMMPEDIQEAAMKYVGAIRSKLRHKSNRDVIRQTRKLYRSRKRLVGLLAELKELGKDVQLPVCVALMDLGLHNMIKHDKSDSILVIDHELAMQAHFGFDASYVMHVLYRKGLPTRELDLLGNRAFSVEYLGSDSAAAFFRRLYTMLNELYDLVAR